jgi:hypothetical protein
MRRTKGQAVFEFIVAAILFFAIIFYIITFLDSSISNYSAGSQANSLEAKAMEVSEYLVHVNLTGGWPVISYDSINRLDDACNDDYTGMLDRFDAGNKRVKLQINDGANMLLDCERARMVPETQRAEVERFALSEDNTILNIRVIVW